MNAKNAVLLIWLAMYFCVTCDAPTVTSYSSMLKKDACLKVKEVELFFNNTSIIKCSGDF